MPPRYRLHLRIVCLLLLLVALGSTHRCAAQPPPAQPHVPIDASEKFALVVYGGTPSGVACAVRAAREGLDVLLVSHTPHLGGLLSNGLSVMDSLYNGPRAPIYDELRRNIYVHYRTTYGKDSPQYKSSLPGHPKTRYEAHIAERLVNNMLAAESRITLVTGYYPTAAKQDAGRLSTVTFRQKLGRQTFTATGNVFADCSYEGDLAAVARVPYRVGRESRKEYNEPHAGVLYMYRVPWPPANVDPAYLADYHKLNLFHYKRWLEIIPEVSTGKAHPAVQAYNMRTVLTDDPNNRVMPTKPDDYDPEKLRTLRYDQVIGYLPNRKYCWNLPELVGAQTEYVEGDWKTRARVTRQHRELSLAMLYFLQNDPKLPAEVRSRWRKYGLPKDEFADNGHMPYEVYMRETRRIVGRYVFTEHDARLARNIKRAPIHADSISITEWYLDSHACTPRKQNNSLHEGEMLLNNITFPGQVPYRSLLPRKIDNLLVPVCLSSSHVGWGTIRLEPTWMSLGEAARFAAALAVKNKITPAEVTTDRLLRLLARRGVMISFFNDVEKHQGEKWLAAVQYLATQGYFGSYDARADAPLSAELAEAWLVQTRLLLQGRNENPTAQAADIRKAEQQGKGTVSGATFAKKLAEVLEVRRQKSSPQSQPTPATPAAAVLNLLDRLKISREKPITRGDACRLIFEGTENLLPRS